MSVFVPQKSSRTNTIDSGNAPALARAPSRAWTVVGWLGFGYFVMSMLDLALGWYPLGFGSPEWEFGTLSASMAGLAIPTLALYLMLASALARNKVNLARSVGIIVLIMAVLIGVLCAIYLSSLPIALNAVASNPVVHLGVQKAIAKTLMLCAGYEILYLTAALVALRRQE